MFPNGNLYQSKQHCNNEPYGFDYTINTYLNVVYLESLSIPKPLYWALRLVHSLQMLGSGRKRIS